MWQKQTVRTECLRKYLVQIERCRKYGLFGRQDTGSHQQSTQSRGSKLSEREFFSAFSSPHFSEVGRVEHKALHRDIHFWNSIYQG